MTGRNPPSQRKHGHSWVNGRPSPEYMAWTAMKSRCMNPNHRGFANYGGRGIKVCKRWVESFEAFLEDMGPRPGPKHSIDRIDNNGNYEPENCEWRTIKEQSANRRGVHRIWFNGRTWTATDIASAAGRKRHTIAARIARGVPVEELFL